MKQVSLIGIIFLFIARTAIAGMVPLEPIAQPAYESSSPSKIQYSYTLSNTTNRVVDKADFWVYAPVQKGVGQRILDLTISQPGETITDELGNQVLHFSFNNFPPFTSKIITIESELDFVKESVSLSDREQAIYLNPAPLVEADQPEIVRLAGELKQDDNLSTARNFFDWVANNIAYAGYLHRPQGALYALQNKRGDCTEFAVLFVALCRAAGIPARTIGGYVSTNNTILKPADYHDWAEFYHAGAWQLADPQKKVFMGNEVNYVAMRIIGESISNPLAHVSRFKVIGQGIEARMN